ncbi:DNA translocase SpoIIIE [termite gut metagenome]|uniref:DNA translocase SpoIIIE n=1 Tax=termite gut metagenome TaxID=433724 RepID=A0A5J4STZ5_9ZZZZ
MPKKNSEKSPSKLLSFFKEVIAFVKNETFHFITGLLLVLFSVYLLLALTSFFFTGVADQSILDGDAELLSSINNGVKNYAGSRGAQLASYLINDCFGISSFFFVVMGAVFGIHLMRIYVFRIWKWLFCCMFLLIWFSVCFSFAFTGFYKDSFVYWGGMHGYNANTWLVSQVGSPGTGLILLATGLCFLIYASSKTIVWIHKFFGMRHIRRREKIIAKYKNTSAGLSPIEEAQTDTGEKETHTSKEVNNENFEEVDMTFEATESDDVPFSASQPYAGKTDAPLGVEISENSDGDDENYHGIETEPYNPKLDLEHYHFPTLDLLKFYDNRDLTINMEEQKANKERIITTLRSFGIEISTIKATVGATVTLYEITPEQGVRISKIRGLEDDIALSLSALGIRIIAPIPGKGTIGIEVPNSNPKIVSMQSIIGSKKFQESNYDLPIALGKTITNEVFMVDLCKMPHILVAGATGQGKSVGLNAIITSLLYKKHPAELKFVLVDPKKVEFSIYSVIEHHFLAKLPDGEEAIITDVTKVVQTLSSICVEMDSRYDLLKKAHVRNIKEYNEKFINRRLNPGKGHKFMPYVVVVIDEFGDLIMTAGKEIELPIARIAQLARAIGIHMIIATQRPTTNIITGTIKANFPARVAFRVSAMMDSRTIIDRPGANQLIGRGDMLFLQGADPVRVQCAFVDTSEVEDVAKFIAKQQSYPTAFYLPEYVNESNANDSNEIDMGRLDPLFEEAARLVVIHQQGSTSLIQRKFSIGYNRAGRIMDQLEKSGIVGPSEGSKPRQVMCIDENDLQVKMRDLL